MKERVWEIREAMRRGKVIKVTLLWLGMSLFLVGVILTLEDLLGAPSMLLSRIVAVACGLGYLVALGVTWTKAPVAAAEQSADGEASEDPATNGLGGKRRRLRVGLVALAVIILAAGTPIAYDAFRPTLIDDGMLDEGDRVVLADFSSTPADPSVERTVTEYLRADLQKSSPVKPFELGSVRANLQRMGRPPEERLTPRLAKDVARRAGIKAFVHGEVNRTGERYSITAHVTTVDDSTLISEQETANTASEITDAMRKLSKRIRNRIGESFASLIFSSPLAKVTTTNTGALEDYMTALRLIDLEGDWRRGVTYLERATEPGMDPGFMMALRKLAVTLDNIEEQRQKAVDAIKHAYEQSFETDRRWLPREIYLTRAAYHDIVTGRWDTAIEEYQKAVDLDSLDGVALNNMAVDYLELRLYPLAEQRARGSITADRNQAVRHRNLIEALFNQGRVDEADSALAVYADSFPAGAHFAYSMRAAAAGDYDGAENHIEMARDETGGPNPYHSQILAFLDLARGRVASAQDHVEKARNVFEQRRNLPGRLELEASLALFYVLVTRQPEAARRHLDDVLRHRPLDSIPAPLDRPYARLIEVYALAGDSIRARDLMTSYDSLVDPELVPPRSRADAKRARAAVALAEGNHDEAIRLYEEADIGRCRVCALGLLAQTYEAAESHGLARDHYQEYAEAYDARRLNADAFFRGPVFERLARYYEDGLQHREAARYYRRFFELWEEASQALQPRVRSARSRFESICGRFDLPDCG